MMIDTNIVIDVLEEDARWYEWSATALASVDGLVSASAIVVGELAMRRASQSDLMAMLTRFGITVKSLDADASFRAGMAHLAYREAGGTREKLLADFLIGAHAETQNLALITRDPRRYRRYFPDLTLITPETEA